MLFKVFIVLGLIAGAFTIGKAFATGSIQLRGEKQPLRREDDPQRFKQTMGIITVVLSYWLPCFVGYLWFRYLFIRDEIDYA